MLHCRTCLLRHDMYLAHHELKSVLIVTTMIIAVVIIIIIITIYALLPYMQGACGYGYLANAAVYPFFSAVGIPTNSDIMSFPTMGCGTCIEFECVNDRSPDFAVGTATLHACDLW